VTSTAVSRPHPGLDGTRTVKWADADVDTLALMLIGSGHLLFAGREGTPPEETAVRTIVTTVVAGVSS
jgi:hypothetical protein